MAVIGPAHFNPQAPPTLDIFITDPAGNRRDAKLEIEYVDSTPRKSLAKKEVASHGGMARIQVPKDLDVKSNRLDITVKAKDSPAPPALVKLARTEPVYVMHLATNKSSYNNKEPLFFRIVALEEYSLKPIATPIALRYSLKDMDGKTVKEFDGKTGPGGIGSGEFEIANDIPSGTYNLEAAAKTGSSIVSQPRQLEILRETTPRLVLEKNYYYPDETVNVYAGNSLNSYAYPVTMLQQSVRGNDQQRGLLDNQGLASFQLQKGVNTAQVEMQNKQYDA